MSIQYVNELKNYFHHSNNFLKDSVYVPAHVRMEWLLEDEKIVVKGNYYDRDFKNKGGGVFFAC